MPDPRFLRVLLAAALLASCGVTREPASLTAGPPRSAAAVPAAPSARAISERLEAHGDVRIDDYFWLRERDDPRVLDYLRAENAYTEAVMAPTAELQERLYRELVGREKQDDSTVPYREGDYLYYTRYEDGGSYPIHCRKAGEEAPEEIVVDVNRLAEGHGFCSVRGPVVRSDGRIAAYAVDTVGRRIYTLRFRDLAAGTDLADVIPDVTGNVAWAEDGGTVFYARQDPTTLRSFRIFRHTLGQDPAGDALVYEEEDETFRCFVFKTKSRRFVMIGSFQTLSAEYRCVPADRPLADFQVILPRERGHEHRIDHHGDHFYVYTNDGAKNFRLVRAPIATPGRAHWEEVIPHRADVYLEAVEVFRDRLVLVERRDGLVRLRVRGWDGSDDHYVDFGEEAYDASLRDNEEYGSPTLRFAYSSMTTPSSIYDYDMAAHEQRLRKRDEVLGGFDPAHYVTRRLFATAADGTKVPISLVHRKAVERTGANPLLLYGYGSYGASMDASFDADRVSLLDRGFVYAIAHVRGGSEMGRGWYEGGKLFNKKNTFTDFIACAEQLVREGYTSPEHLYAMGGSAGGLLVGAVANMRPDLFNGIVAAVPFVDVVTTMFDSSIPLTTSEYDEWGDPNDGEYYRYILSYSPYDQVAAREYPHMLVTTGLHDSQVQYWEPAKWVAKLRAMKTDDNLLVFKTNMSAGHGGASGRYDRYRETALRYAFLLDREGIRR